MSTEQEEEAKPGSEEHAALPEGTIVAERYRIIDVLGKGGMGVVYKVEQIHMNRIVAMKMMLEKHTGTSLDYRRFKREAQSASQLDHPNIVSIHDFGFDQGQAYLCMDYLEGKNLDDVLPDGPLTLEQFGHIFSQACDALQHAHEKGIVHRDLKPSNIMITERRTDKLFVVILDFGLVKVSQQLQDGDHKLTATDMLVGTPLYMSPEQCQGQEVGPSSDIYSLACVMYECLTLRPPVWGTTMLEIMAAHVLQDPTPFSDANPDLFLPPALDKVIMQALSKKPEERPQSMKELGKAIKLALQSSGANPHSIIAPADIRSMLADDAKNKDDSEQHSNKNAEEKAAKEQPAGDPNAAAKVKEKAEAQKADTDSYKSEIDDDDDDALMPLTAKSLVGEIIDNNFKILELIGKGGMSVVYKARSQMLNKIVAIKTMHAHLVSDINSLHRFRQEAQASSQLDHPHVISVYAFGVTTGDKPQPYIVMDYIDGVSLSDSIKQQGALPVPDVLKMFIQVASALAHAHNKGVIHRDLKPSNIMLVKKDDDPQFVRIVDFGIAKILPQEDEGGQQAHRLTQTGDVFGSPTYMSPEQCMGKSVDKRSDIYAIGCVLYEALTGKPPHQGDSVFELLHKHTSEMPASVKIAGAEQGLLDRIDAIIFRALEKDPEKRYQSMADLEKDLQALQNDVVSGRKGSDIRFGLARHQRSLLRLLKSHKKLVALTVAVLITLGSSVMAWSKTSWFFGAHEFKAPSYDWIDFLPVLHKKLKVSDDERRKRLDLGKTAMKMGRSMNGTESILIVKTLKEYADYCAELSEPDEESKARRRVVNIMNAAGSNDSIEYAESCEALAECLMQQKLYDAAKTQLDAAAKVRSKENRDFQVPRTYLNLAFVGYKLNNEYTVFENLGKANSCLHEKENRNDLRLSVIAHALNGDANRNQAEHETDSQKQMEKWKEADSNLVEAQKFRSEERSKNESRSESDTRRNQNRRKPSKLDAALAIERAYLNLQMKNYQEASTQFSNAMPYLEEHEKIKPSECQEILDAYAYASWNSNDFLRAIALREQAIKLGNDATAEDKTESSKK